MVKSVKAKKKKNYLKALYMCEKIVNSGSPLFSFLFGIFPRINPNFLPVIYTPYNCSGTCFQISVSLPSLLMWSDPNFSKSQKRPLA